MIKKLKRSELLDRELIDYNPVEVGLNLPGKNYTLRIEDIIPALSGAIGKIALTAAFALAWSKALHITDPGFVTENVRLEVIVGSILTLIISSMLNPYAATPGTLAPLIPLIPLMAASGVHPLVLGIMIGILGILISLFKFFDKIVEINGTAARGGIILLFGIMGITSSIDSLAKWSSAKSGSLFACLIVLGILSYLILSRLGYKWLMIPAAAVIALLVSALFKLYPAVNTGPGLPILNPHLWWFDKWKIGWGFTPVNFVKALPFALLAVVMWPTDALAIKALQESNYPSGAQKSIFKMSSTFIAVSVRNIIGSILGGAQTSAVWRSFMIPLSIVKRPIGGSSLLLGITGILFGLLGFPLDIAVFPPLIWLVLMFGVYMPLVEIGLSTLKTSVQAQTAGLCILTGLAVNPVLGWVTAILIENLRLIKGTEGEPPLSMDKIRLTIGVSLLTVFTYVLSYVF